MLLARAHIKVIFRNSQTSPNSGRVQPIALTWKHNNHRVFKGLEGFHMTHLGMKNGNHQIKASSFSEGFKDDHILAIK